MSETFAVGDMATYTGRLAGKPLECKIIKAMPVEHAMLFAATASVARLKPSIGRFPNSL